MVNKSSNVQFSLYINQREFHTHRDNTAHVIETDQRTKLKETLFSMNCSLDGTK